MKSNTEPKSKTKAKIHDPNAKLFLRYDDLVEKGVVSNRPQLGNMIKNYGFPVGRKFGPNTRAWTSDEVTEWCNSRPTDRKPDRRHPAHNQTEAA